MGLKERFKDIFKPSPEEQAREAMSKRYEEARRFFNELDRISSRLPYGTQRTPYQVEQIREVTERWINSKGRIVFPAMDEFVPTPGVRVQTSDYAQRQRHYAFTFEQLQAWIQNQEVLLNLK